MKVFLYGNCQLKIVSQYISDHPDVTDYESKLFYILKDVNEIKSIEHWLTDCDIFIYQNVSESTLKTKDETLNVSDYTTSKLIERFKFKKCVCLPSIYFAGYFPEPIPTQLPIFNKDIIFNKYKKKLLIN